MISLGEELEPVRENNDIYFTKESNKLVIVIQDNQIKIGDHLFTTKDDVKQLFDDLYLQLCRTNLGEIFIQTSRSPGLYFPVQGCGRSLFIALSQLQSEQTAKALQWLIDAVSAHGRP